MKKANSSSIYDRIAMDYEEHFGAQQFKHENSMMGDFIASQLHHRLRVKKILDLGCGTGLGYTICETILNHPFNYNGVDSSAEIKASKK